MFTAIVLVHYSTSIVLKVLSDNNFFAAIGPAKESAVAIIRQCLTIFDPQRDFAEESKALSAQLIAELAKTDVGRSLCLHQVVIEHSPAVE